MVALCLTVLTFLQERLTVFYPNIMYSNISKMKKEEVGEGDCRVSTVVLPNIMSSNTSKMEKRKWAG